MTDLDKEMAVFFAKWVKLHATQASTAVDIFEDGCLEGVVAALGLLPRFKAAGGASFFQACADLCRSELVSAELPSDLDACIKLGRLRLVSVFEAISNNENQSSSHVH
jgi:hypothetical protein